MIEGAAIERYEREALEEFANVVSAEKRRVPYYFRHILAEHIRLACLVRLQDARTPLNIRRTAEEITDDFVRSFQATHPRSPSAWRQILRRWGLA